MQYPLNMNTKIEETLTHQAQQIQDLSDVVISQSKEIEELKKSIAKLQGKIEMIESDESASTENLADVKPPHY